ncbi:hypothetical protein C1645_732058 [Glomus cerebriforme]|uniref:Uncharacterized protein n=1 Tax=Glomus cerebriforme TaxID=658196 RepID=A0A397TI64_9GLOM|nr:hypothetical protein C1645_732058 [Glomus cerebriforme]
MKSKYKIIGDKSSEQIDYAIKYISFILIISVNEVNPSKLKLLRQYIKELKAENAEISNFRRKILEFDAERVDLRRKISEFDAEIAELKHKIAEALRANEEYNKRRDAENAKLKARIKELEKKNTKENAKLRDRIMKNTLKKVDEIRKTVNHVNDPDKSMVDLNIVTEFVQDLLEELLSSDD